MNKFFRKFASVVLCLAVSCGCVTAASAAGTAYGDIDNNGSIDSLDSLAALEHSVDKSILEGGSFTRADVNADGLVNSYDALDILLYAVGKKPSFDVENSVSMTDNEILALYRNSLSNAKSKAPGYLIERTKDYKNINVKVKDPLGMLKLAGMTAADLEKEMKDSFLDDNTYVNTYCVKGSDNAKNNLPAQCKLTDASKLKSIKASALPDGNIKISIYLNDEKNPSSSSTVCKMFGMPDYDTTLKDLLESSDMEGAEDLSDIKLEELSYKNAWVICEVNPNTKEIVNYDYGMDIKNVSSISMMSINVKTDLLLNVVTNYSNFDY